MLNEEDKKAIEYLTKYIHWETAGERSLETDIETVLNLITKLQKENKNEIRARDLLAQLNETLKKEIKEKDKQIDLMARSFRQDDARSVEEIKKYFERKVEDERN